MLLKIAQAPLLYCRLEAEKPGDVADNRLLIDELLGNIRKEKYLHFSDKRIDCNAIVFHI